VAFYADGNLQAASASCENKADDPVIQLCLALTYEKLGRHTDAEATLKKVMNSRGDAEAVSYAEFYAQRGDTLKALDWLETAMRLRRSDLVNLNADPLLDPLRKEPRLQAIERALKFPS
jgi:tetratricopeptide (TPR) repeat protein